jgi:methylenetetrahydrofolate--tRNA-(uracil-5-)-methyltransferase
MAKVAIVGGGMAGTEAAFQLAARGVEVRLYEMRPVVPTAAHHGSGLAELVCSNSFRGDSLANAVGLLKEEMRRAGGRLMHLAEQAAVPAGGALAVDRDVFSSVVTAAIEAEPLIELVREEIRSLPVKDADLTIVATGPLTSGALAEAIQELTGSEQLYFYDAIAPIIDAESIDLDIVFAQSRYDKGEGADYLNCPFTEAEYLAFIEAVRAAELAPVKSFEETKFFEACLPIEVMAARGVDTPRFGPMKPVGLTDPRTGESPHGVVQLRTENLQRTAYNLVGFQSRMKWGEQKRIFRSIPGLENAEFLRFGSVHRNTFLHGPKLLGSGFELRADPRIRFAGQITGVEGYVESMACGLMASWSVLAELGLIESATPPETTALGGLLRHVTGADAFDPEQFQPSNVNWSMMPLMPGKKIRKRRLRRLKLAERALQMLEEWQETWPNAARVTGFAKRDIEDAYREMREMPAR